MSEEIVDKVIEQLDKVGELGGQAIEIYTRQAFIEGIYATVIGILGLIFLIIVPFIMFKLLKKAHNTNNNQEEDKYFGLVVVCGFVAVVLATPAFIFGIVDSKQVINPEYYAIQELIDQVR